VLHINKLQRKILLVIVLIILLPMLITGSMSAAWISARMDDSIKQRLREALRIDADTLADLHENAHLFADMLRQVGQGKLNLRAAHTPVPSLLRPLAHELGITLIQVYDQNNHVVYSSPPNTQLSVWSATQEMALVKVSHGERQLLAAITEVQPDPDSSQAYRLVLGTLIDQTLLRRLSHDTGLITRLYYARDGEFTSVSDDTPLKSVLPTAAIAQLQNKQDYFTPHAEHGQYWGLYSPVLDHNGKVEAVLFSGQARVGGSRWLTDQTVLTLAIFLLGTLLAIATGLLLSRFVVRPVAYLHEGVLRLAAQDFRAKIPIESEDELGDLAQAFNSMADSLREARDAQQREFQRDKLTALGELSLAMAHEIRNPVGIINTASRLLETTEDNSKRSELRRAIREESVRLDRLLSDFQQLARHHRPQLAAIDPAAPLESALQVMLTDRNHIAITRRYAHGSLQVQGDADLLRRAWINLIRNALEAMGNTPGSLEVGSIVESNAVLLYLHDSGPGIPIEQMTRLFEPFYTTKEHGSGLGLTIANTLVEASGARLELVPGNWRGARFAMIFPYPTAESV
jgi:signal transduction histidine kinase